MCRKVYIGQTGHSIQTRIKKHQWHIQLYHLKKSTVVEHSINSGHHIQDHYTRILAKKSRCMEHIIRDVIQTELHSNHMNREGLLSHRVMEASLSNPEGAPPILLVAALKRD
jgi:hypothetical protein